MRPRLPSTMRSRMVPLPMKNGEDQWRQGLPPSPHAQRRVGRVGVGVAAGRQATVFTTPPHIASRTPVVCGQLIGKPLSVRTAI